MQCPQEAHWEATLRVVRYLKGHPGQGLLLRRDSDLQLNAYCDSDWATCPLSRRSLTGYFIMLSASPISWKTKKQPIVARSSAEAEYRSMAVTSGELVWLKSLLQSLGVLHVMPMRLFCDSQAALHIAANPCSMNALNILRWIVTMCVTKFKRVILSLLMSARICNFLTSSLKPSANNNLTIFFAS